MCKPGSGRLSGRRLDQLAGGLHVAHGGISHASSAGQRTHAPHTSGPLLQDAHLGRGRSPARVGLALSGCHRACPRAIFAVRTTPLDLPTTLDTGATSSTRFHIVGALAGHGAETEVLRPGDADTRPVALLAVRTCTLLPGRGSRAATGQARPRHRLVVDCPRHLRRGGAAHGPTACATDSLLLVLGPLPCLPACTGTARVRYRLNARGRDLDQCAADRAGALLGNLRPWLPHLHLSLAGGTVCRPDTRRRVVAQILATLGVLAVENLARGCACVVRHPGMIERRQALGVTFALPRGSGPLLTHKVLGVRTGTQLGGRTGHQNPPLRAALLRSRQERSHLRWRDLLAVPRAVDPLDRGCLYLKTLFALPTDPIARTLGTRGAIPPVCRRNGKQRLTARTVFLRCHWHPPPYCSKFHSYLDDSVAGMVGYGKRRRRPPLPAGERTTSGHSDTEHNTPMAHMMENKQAANRGRVGGGLFFVRSEGDASKPPLHCAFQAQCSKIHSHILPPC